MCRRRRGHRQQTRLSGQGLIGSGFQRAARPARIPATSSSALASIKPRSLSRGEDLPAASRSRTAAADSRATSARRLRRTSGLTTTATGFPWRMMITSSPSATRSSTSGNVARASLNPVSPLAGGDSSGQSSWSCHIVVRHCTSNVQAPSGSTATRRCRVAIEATVFASIRQGTLPCWWWVGLGQTCAGGSLETSAEGRSP